MQTTTEPNSDSDKIKYLLGTAILIFSLLHIPKFSAHFTSYHRGISISIVLMLYAVKLIFFKGHGFKFSLADVGWIGLVTLSFISAVWSLNPYHAIFGGFSTLLVYLCYKFFEGISWSKLTIRRLRILFLCFALSALGILVYANFLPHQTINTTAKLSGTNNHYLGSLVFVLLPFILIIKKKVTHILIAALILLGISIIVYKAHSLQVFLCSFITCLFFIVLLKRASLKEMLGVFSAAIIIALSVIIILNTNKEYFTNNFELLKEFDHQSSRLEMWENSVGLFRKSPLTGVGKNSWKNEVGQFGYNNYDRVINNKFRPKMILHHAHSWFFQTIAELGILGFLNYFIIFLSCFFSLKKNEKIDDLSYAALFSILSFLWLGLMYGVIYNFSGHFVGLPILLVLGISIINRYAKFNYTLAQKSAGLTLLIGSVFCLVFFCTALNNDNKSRSVEQLIRHQKYTEALSILETITFAQDKGKIYAQVARVQVGLENDSIANDVYFKAINLSPYDINLLHNYSKFLYKISDYESAIHYSSKLFKLAKNFITNELHMIECLHKIGDSEKVVEQGNKLRKKLIEELNIYREILIKIDHELVNGELVKDDYVKDEIRLVKRRIKKYKQMKLRLEKILANYKLN